MTRYLFMGYSLLTALRMTLAKLLWGKIEMHKTVHERRVEVSHRISKSVMADIERQVSATCVVTNQSTAEVIAWQLGVQHALNTLKAHYSE